MNIPITIIKKKLLGGPLIQKHFDSNCSRETVGPVCLIMNSICANIGSAHQVDRGSQEKRERDEEKAV